MSEGKRLRVERVDILPRLWWMESPPVVSGVLLTIIFTKLLNISLHNSRLTVILYRKMFRVGVRSVVKLSLREVLSD